MSVKASEVLPNISDPILNTVDKMRGNDIGITSSAVNGREYTIDLWSITPENIAGEINKRIKWNENARNVESQDFNSFENIWERRQLKREQRVVNAIRFNGDTAFVTQQQRFGVAYSMAERLVGKKDEFAFGAKTDVIKDQERKDEFGVILDHLAVALGHKKTIQKVEQQKKFRQDHHL